MGTIWLTSDLHFCHNREFIYKPRGFNSIEEMNEAILSNYNSVVDENDDVYILGDLMLGDNNQGIEYLRQLKGKIHIVYGNHDTNTRKELYNTLPNCVETAYALPIKYNKYNFYCSHFPTLTANLEVESIHQVTLNLFGHTHSNKLFYNDIPFMYNVAIDAHNCYPVNIEHIINDIKDEVKVCQNFL